MSNNVLDKDVLENIGDNIFSAVIDALLNFVANEERIRATQADKPEIILSEYKL